MAFLLDTNIAIGIGDERRAIKDRVAHLAGPQYLSGITVVELHGGVAATPDRAAERRAAIALMLRLFEVLPVDAPVVEVYAVILARTGFSRPRILDRLIAATAMVHDLTLITTNGPDFSSIPGLKLEIWPRPAQ